MVKTRDKRCASYRYRTSTVVAALKYCARSGWLQIKNDILEFGGTSSWSVCLPVAKFCQCEIHPKVLIIKTKQHEMSGFWKPESSKLLHEESSRDREVGSVPFNFSNAPLAQQRLLLPIYKHKRQILYGVEHHRVTVIVGETSTGKSTQVPQYLFDNGWCENDFQVACTQPRRIAAQTLAQRVSHEVGKGPVGATVGYSVRFDDKTSGNTKIKFLTDGMLLREAILHDPMLSRYSVIMVDEAHERNINSDTILGLLKKILRKRTDLRIIICSATINADKFLDYFVGKGVTTKKRKRRWDNPDDSKDVVETEKTTGTIISVDGRQFSVDVMYLQTPTNNYIRSCIETA